MSQKILPDDLFTKLREYEERISRLERAAVTENSKNRIFSVTSVSSIDLGSFDGDEIIGVRISGHGRTSGHGGNTYFRLLPNNSSAWLAGSHALRVLSQPSLTSDAQYGGSMAAPTSPIFAATDWTVDSNTLSFDGVLYTNRDNASVRHYAGHYMNQDMSSDGHRRLTAMVGSTFWDGTTPMNSLHVALDAGVFTGRVKLEIIT
jgi:hypothetical protein